MVAPGVGVNILDANDAEPFRIIFNQFTFAVVFARKTIVKGGGGGEGCVFVLDYADGATVADQDFFEFQSFGGGGFFTSIFGVV